MLTSSKICVWSNIFVYYGWEVLSITSVINHRLLILHKVLNLKFVWRAILVSWPLYLIWTLSVYPEPAVLKMMIQMKMNLYMSSLLIFRAEILWFDVMRKSNYVMGGSRKSIYYLTFPSNRNMMKVKKYFLQWAEININFNHFSFNNYEQVGHYAIFFQRKNK